MELDYRLPPAEIELLLRVARGDWTDIKLPTLTRRLRELGSASTFGGTGLFVEGPEQIYIGTVGSEINKTTFCRLAVASAKTAPLVFSELVHTAGIGSLVTNSAVAHLRFKDFLGKPLKVFVLRERRDENVLLGDVERQMRLVVDSGLLVSAGDSLLLVHLDGLFHVKISTDERYIQGKIEDFEAIEMVAA